MFSRIANLLKGFLSLFVSGVERRNPEALLELEQENLRKQIGNFNQGLASHAGLSERLMSQVRKLEAEQKDVRAKTTAHVRAGNNSAAGQYALRLQSVEAQLAENRTQLEQAETTYKNLVKARDVAVQTARAKIESLKGAINDMRMKQAKAEIQPWYVCPQPRPLPSRMAGRRCATAGLAGPASPAARPASVRYRMRPFELSATCYQLSAMTHEPPVASGPASRHGTAGG